MKKCTPFAIIITVAILIGSCSEDEAGSMFIKVNYSGTVNETNKLFVQIYTDKRWISPIYKQGSATATILVPEFISVQMYIYLAVFHDLDGDSELSSGDPFIGWFNISDPANNLTGILFPSSGLLLDMTLDPSNTW